MIKALIFRRSKVLVPPESRTSSKFNHVYHLSAHDQCTSDHLINSSDWQMPAVR